MTAKQRINERQTWKDQFQFLLVSPRDRDWGLYVTAAGCQIIPPYSPYPTRGHSPSHDWVWRHGRVLQEYAVVYVTRGKGEFESKPSGTTTIEAGNALLLFPGVWHRYRPEKEVGWDNYWVTFHGEYADRLHERGFLTPESPVLRIGLDDLVQHAFTTLLDRVHGEKIECHRQPLMAASVMEIIAGILSRCHCKDTSGHVREAVRRAKLVLEGSIDRFPNIKELIEDSGLSRSYFHQAFKQCTGLTPCQYRLQVQIGRAKEMLQNSSLSVKQIGHLVQFTNIDQFVKMFKKKMGMTPSEYRNGGAGTKAVKSPLPPE